MLSVNLVVHVSFFFAEISLNKMCCLAHFIRGVDGVDHGEGLHLVFVSTP